MFCIAAWLTWTAAMAYSHRAENSTAMQWYHVLPAMLMTLALCFTIGYRPISPTTQRHWFQYSGDGEMDRQSIVNNIWLIVICLFAFGGFGAGILLAMMDFLSPTNSANQNITISTVSERRNYDIWTGQMLIACVVEMLLALIARWKQLLTQNEIERKMAEDNA